MGCARALTRRRCHEAPATPGAACPGGHLSHVDAVEILELERSPLVACFAQGNHRLPCLGSRRGGCAHGQLPPRPTIRRSRAHQRDSQFPRLGRRRPCLPRSVMRSRPRMIDQCRSMSLRNCSTQSGFTRYRAIDVTGCRSLIFSTSAKCWQGSPGSAGHKPCGGPGVGFFSVAADKAPGRARATGRFLCAATTGSRARSLARPALTRHGHVLRSRPSHQGSPT